MTALLHLEQVSCNIVCHQISSTIKDSLNGLIMGMKGWKKQDKRERVEAEK